MDIKEIKRKKLRDWVRLEDIKVKVYEDFKQGNFKDFANDIIQYVTIAYDIEDNKMLYDMPWWEVMFDYENAILVNRPMLKIPMLKTYPKSKKDGVKEITYAWEYPERTWYFFLNRFAKSYNWSAEYIAELDVDDAMALFQEINIDEQLDREFFYSLSEIAYPYDQNRKAGIFKPMERPEWMKELVKILEPRKVKIRKDMMPVGLIIGSKNSDIKH